ncbi:MAG: Mur ligase domain-containing protein, partial [Acidimicrobiia bacterium]
MAEPGVTLDELAAELGGTLSGGSLRVVDATHDSRDAGPGTLFVAVPGFRLDGHDFAAAAVEAGSPAVCVNRPLPLQAAQLV